MKRLLTGGRVWLPQRTFADSCSVLCEGDRILAVGEECRGREYDCRVDLSGAFLFPGLVDVHTHGCIGQDFTFASEAQLQEMKQDYAAHGVTSLFPTLASATREEWIGAIRRIRAVGFDGIHLEGRYLNPKRRGAHSPELLTMPDGDDLRFVLQETGLPCHVTYAPELDGTGAFAQTALQCGATLGIGHTDATAEQAFRAFSAGATAATHLFNAMPPLHHRAGGAAVAAMTSPVYCELIADGLHVLPEMVSLAFRAVGANRLVLISDSMEGTGCPDGEYAIAGQAVFLRNGRAETGEGNLAGSTLRLWDGVKNLMRFASIPIEDAIACATINPARMVGIDRQVGSIEAGKRADLLVVDKELNLQQVLFHGSFL